MKRKGSVELVTTPFRRRHSAIREQLVHASEHVGRLPHVGAAEQRRLMVKVLHLLREHVLRHAHWEEAVLYPVVERQSAGGLVTSSLRQEHVVMARWLDELDRMADSEQPAGISFSRRADQLLGLVLAHLEAEDEVLLPVLDRTMTPAEFERDVMAVQPQPRRSGHRALSRAIP